MPKTYKKILSLALCLITAFSCLVLCGAASESEPFSLCVRTFSNKQTDVSWWKSEEDGKYYIFLPSDCNTKKLKVSFDGAKKIKVGESTVKNGETTNAFSKGGEFKITAGKDDYDVVFVQSKNLPSVYIQTESGSLDYIEEKKTNKEKGSLLAVENGKVTVSENLKYIKGRGNSTWGYDKKPYNIKFENKIDFLGLGKAKKFSLIASAAENSLIRNKSVYDLADKTGLLYSSQSQHIDLYINGDYRGNYLVCESIEVGKNRVDITDLDEANELANPGVDIESLVPSTESADKEAGYKANTYKYVDIPNDPEDISGGYLLEFEQYNRYYKEASGFTTKLGQPVTFKSPEYASKAQVEYIRDFYQEFEDAVYSQNGKNSSGKYYADYIDMTMMARMYIIQELSMNLDSSTTSFYLIKDAKSDKFVASPVWDFDFSLGEKAKRNGVDLTNPNLWYAKSHYLTDDRGYLKATNESMPTLLARLCTYDDFMKTVKKEWAKTFLPVLGESGKNTASQMTALYKSLRASAVMDAVRWNRYDTTNLKKVQKSFDENAKYVVSFLKKRTAALEKGLGKNSADVYYDANGGTGCTYNKRIAQIGDTVIAEGCNFNSFGYRFFFRSWNTKKDGTGTTYLAGDKIKLTDSELTLYAQWEEVSAFRAFTAHLLDDVVKFAYALFSSLIDLI